jgi:stringent starvation protein B
LRRKPDNLTAEYFHGAHLSISAPAYIDLQLDGSAVKLKDYLSKSDRKDLKKAGDAEHVMVNYRFDAMPRALQVAIPVTYNNTLFEHANGKSTSQSEQNAKEEQPASHSEDEPSVQEQSEAENTSNDHDKHDEKVQQELKERVSKLMEQGRKVTVVGVAHEPDKKDKYIIAGGTSKKSTGETRPAAVRVNCHTTIHRSTGEIASPSLVQELQEGSEIVVEGKKNKRGVIPAKHVVV